jgi:HTH-type transcriptional regulator / antitoxin HipB
MHPITHAKQVGATLLGRRKALGLSQAQVAEKLGLSQNRISELEKEPDTLTVQQLLALANVLGLELTIAERPSTRKAEW